MDSSKTSSASGANCCRLAITESYGAARSSLGTPSRAPRDSNGDVTPAAPGVILPKPLVEWCEVNLKNLTIINLGKGLHYLPEDHPHAIGEAPAEWYRAL